MDSVGTGVVGSVVVAGSVAMVVDTSVEALVVLELHATAPIINAIVATTTGLHADVLRRDGSEAVPAWVYDRRMTGGYSIEPLTVDTWDAFAGLVERHNGIFGGCWCTYFHDCAEREPGYEGSRAFKKLMVESGHAHAALVVIGDEAVAWAEYGTPDELPNIHHQKQYLAEADVTPDYRITCIFVDKRYRKHGYAKVALAGALDQIAALGGGVVEGYPHEIGEKRMNNSFVYNGTRTMYEQAGFEFVRSKGMNNTVMRRTIRPA